VSIAVSIERVSKAYRLGAIGGGTLAEDLSRWWAKVRHKPDPTLKIGQGQGARRMGDYFLALDDVGFEIGQGEVIGIVGRNGAGKSTLLKILCQVTAPTSGRIHVRGRIASLLEVGTGFHPELTGRENIFLNGAILGMTKAEIRQRFDEIVAFSECEAFIDTPVKRYSSGMYVRLAFAVAAHLEPEILIVDEVLAVGDAQFQRKCLGKMGDVSRHGRTILFVSHSAAAVSALCTRAVLLKDGRVALDGEVNRVLGAYQVDQSSTGPTASLADFPRIGTGKGKFVAMEIVPVNAEGPVPVVVPGGDVIVRVRIECRVAFEGANVGLAFHDGNGSRILDANTATHGHFLAMGPGQVAVVTFHLHDVLLRPGTYRTHLWLGRSGIEQNIDYVEFAGQMEVHEKVAATKHSETFPGVYQCRFDDYVDLSDAHPPEL
jgi:lipopolysaccharide transport system ATP-binding protein